MDELEQLEKQHTEWEHWQEVCKELAALGVDVNTSNNLVAALKAWANAYHELKTRPD